LLQRRKSQVQQYCDIEGQGPAGVAHGGELLAGKVPPPLREALPNGLSEAQRKTLSLAAARFDELTASTIHAFCQSIITAYAVEADADPGARILDASQQEASFKLVFERWLKRRLGAPGAPGDPIAISVPRRSARGCLPAFEPSASNFCITYSAKSSGQIRHCPPIFAARNFSLRKSSRATSSLTPRWLATSVVVSGGVPTGAAVVGNETIAWLLGWRCLGEDDLVVLETRENECGQFCC
jgi:UvrD/REP helicase N-terminal domain